MREAMFRLYPSTIESIRFYFNSAVLGIAFAAAASVMAATGIPLKWALNYLLIVFEVPERVQAIISQLAMGYPIVFALGILFIGIMDMLNLIKFRITYPINMERDSTDVRQIDREDNS